MRELHKRLEAALVSNDWKEVTANSLGLDSESHNHENDQLGVERNHEVSIDNPSSFLRIARPHGDMLRRPIEPTREVLEDLKKTYIDELKWSYQQLAGKLGVKRSTVGKWFKRNGLSRPSVRRRAVDKV